MTSPTLSTASRARPQAIARPPHAEPVAIAFDARPVIAFQPPAVALPPMPAHNQAALDMFDAHRVGQTPARLAAELRRLRDAGP